jgi:hypothetical protein
MEDIMALAISGKVETENGGAERTVLEWMSAGRDEDAINRHSRIRQYDARFKRRRIYSHTAR